jgi:hypothetical protein
MGFAGATGLEPSWGAVMGELWPVISAPLSPESERFLLAVLHHHGRLRLTETAELPHSLAPEEMLKSLAVQALARWTGLTYLTELQRLELTTPSPALQSTVRAAIQTAKAARPQEPEADAISEEEAVADEAEEGMMWSVSPYPPPRPRPKTAASRRYAARLVGRFGNWTLISGERSRKSSRKEEPEPVG